MSCANYLEQSLGLALSLLSRGRGSVFTGRGRRRVMEQDHSGAPHRLNVIVLHKSKAGLVKTIPSCNGSCYTILHMCAYGAFTGAPYHHTSVSMSIRSGRKDRVQEGGSGGTHIHLEGACEGVERGIHVAQAVQAHAQPNTNRRRGLQQRGGGRELKTGIQAGK